MKLVNYAYAYIPAFSCSIHGKIVMTYDEWTKQVRPYIVRAMPRRRSSYYWSRKMFEQDEKRAIQTPKGNGYRINVRVPTTEAIVARFGLKGYKRGNYMLEIMPSV